jgi:hypothetical protein
VAALLGIVLAGVVAVSTKAAVEVRSEASPFELTVEGKTAWEGFESVVSDEATFKSRFPFCATGTARGPSIDLVPERERFTCDDGTGSVTLSLVLQDTHSRLMEARWQIVEGTGKYVGLRGRGSMRTEHLGGEGEPAVTSSGYLLWRSAFEGAVDWDAVAPTITVARARVTKLRRAPDEHAVRLALSLRDDVEGNPVAYTLIVTQGREVVDQEGTTASGSVSTTLTVARGRSRSLGLHVYASDPVGNERYVFRSLKLPR